MLSDVFSEPEEVTSEDVGQHSETSSDLPPSPIEGLNNDQANLVMELAKTPILSRRDFENLAEFFGLLPDGAIESINDAALDICGALLCEGDDPYEIDKSVAEEMIGR